MKVRYVEGLAPHYDLESCANLPRGGREALTEADAGWVLSHEIFRNGIADLVPSMGRQHIQGRYARVQEWILGVEGPTRVSKLHMLELGELGGIRGC